MARKNASASHSLTPWLLLSVVIIMLDQLTKILVQRNLRFGERVNVIPNFFDLTLVYNKGAAFSFLASEGGWQRWFFIGIGFVASGVILWMLSRHGGQRLFALALSLILGGAIGNVIDRIWQGQVTDFLLMYVGKNYWPAFNVADSAICVGAFCLILDEILRVRRTSKGGK